MFYSTVSSLGRKASLSSDEDGDIYCQTGRDVSNCVPSKTDKLGLDGELALDALNRGVHKPEQVGWQHPFQKCQFPMNQNRDAEQAWKAQHKQDQTILDTVTTV